MAALERGVAAMTDRQPGYVERVEALAEELDRPPLEDRYFDTSANVSKAKKAHVNARPYRRDGRNRFRFFKVE